MAAWQIVRAADRLELAGELRIRDAAEIWRCLDALVADHGPQLDFDLHRAELVDGAVMAMLVELRASLVTGGARSEIVGAPRRIQPIVHLYRGDEPPAIVATVLPPHVGVVARIGRGAAAAAHQVCSVVAFAGRLAGALIADTAHVDWRALPGLVVRAGTDGIPVIVVLDFLVGFVMAYQSSRELQIYGANLYVADVVGLSMTRELAPLVTAIIIAGRSGASYAAELGSMCIAEEVDALRTMGFSPIAHLVAPRTTALAIAAPVLALLGAVAGVTGGLVVAAASLRVTPSAYVSELRSVLVPADVWTGLVKSFVFGIAIALIGCRAGLATRGSASAVGRSTTATVVACLFAIVVIDTLFTVFFRSMGL